MTSDPTSGPERETVEPAPLRPSAGSRLMTPAIAGSVVLLLISALTSVGWVVANGGVALPPRAATPALAAASTPPGAVSPGHGPGESGAPGTSPAGSPAAEVPTHSAPPAATPGPTPSGPTPSGPTPGPTPAPSGAGPGPSVPVETPRPSPTSDRYAVLVPCPGAADCYRYTVRAGDNLWSIARWFGVPLETVYERNPELRSSALRPGTEIVLPTPTR